MIEKRGKKEYHKKKRLQCEFETFGNKCKLIGSITPHVGDGTKWFCSFHYEAYTKGRDFNTFSSFKEWLENYREQYPIKIYGVPHFNHTGKFVGNKGNQFHRFEAEVLWELMGNNELPR